MADHLQVCAIPHIDARQAGFHMSYDMFRGNLLIHLQRPIYDSAYHCRAFFPLHGSPSLHPNGLWSATEATEPRELPARLAEALDPGHSDTRDSSSLRCTCRISSVLLLSVICMQCGRSRMSAVIRLWRINRPTQESGVPCLCHVWTRPASSEAG